VTFQAYLDAVKAKTGKTPSELTAAAEEAGVHDPDMTATQLVDWLKAEYGLGRGHSMAVWAVFKDQGWVHAPGM
jgi:transposase